MDKNLIPRSYSAGTSSQVSRWNHVVSCGLTRPEGKGAAISVTGTVERKKSSSNPMSGNTEASCRPYFCDLPGRELRNRSERAFRSNGEHLHTASALWSSIA
jgi:hypothetical protein